VTFSDAAKAVKNATNLLELKKMTPFQVCIKKTFLQALLFKYHNDLEPTRLADQNSSFPPFK
jgi:hypothetical protein